MVIKNVMLAEEHGLGNGETPIFPIHIFKVKEGVNYNEGDPNYDLFRHALRCSAKRLFPNFSFLDAPFNLQYYKPGDYNTEVAYMGCRTRVMGNVFDNTKEVTCGRGNLSFTSINLPRIGIEAKGDMKTFYKLLDEKIALVEEQLLHRFKIQCSKKVYNYPFLMGQGVWIDSEKLDRNDSVAEVLKHGTLSVGFIGLAETLKALTGKHHGESEESWKLGLEIISHMREKMDEKSRETGLNFTLLATPAEGLSGRFVRIDQKKYGKIPGVTDREYYTNSFHVPVYYPISAFEKIAIEAPYHALTNAGHISYVELDGDTADQRFMDNIVNMLGLDDKLNNMPNQLSGGQQQRVAIARALISKPAIVLADEPTGNLDSKTSSEVLGLLKRTSEEFHQTIVMITHNNDIARLADRIVRIEDGKITGGMKL